MNTTEIICNHEVKVRSGFLKQRIWIDGKKVPREFLRYTLPSFLVYIEGTVESGDKVTGGIFQRDRIEFNDGKTIVNGHELDI